MALPNVKDFQGITMSYVKCYFTGFTALILLFFSGPTPANEFDQIFEKHAVVMLLIEPQSGKIFKANHAASAYYGYSKSKLQKMYIQQINALSPEAVAAERELAEKENRNYFIFRHRLADGSIRTVEVSSVPVDFGRQTYLFSIITDVNDLRAAEDTLWHYQNRLETMVDEQLQQIQSKNMFIYSLLTVTAGLLLLAATTLAVLLYRKRKASIQLLKEKSRLNDIIWGTNAGTWERDFLSERIQINSRWAQITGYSTDELSPFTLARLESMTHPDDLPTVQHKLSQHLTGKQKHYECEYRLKHKKDCWVWVLDRGRIVENDPSGNPLRLCGTLQDITDSKKAQVQLEQMAHYDQLTQLANRTLFYDRLNHALASAKRYPTRFAVMFLDLDGFKEVNDRYGHHIGDALLTEVAQRLQDTIRESDTCARMGGDEFALIIYHLEHSRSAGIVAEHILRQLQGAYQLGGHTLSGISCSIGIALHPDHDSAAGNTLVQQADKAMYLAKRSGKNSFAFAGEKESADQESASLPLSEDVKE